MKLKEFRRKKDWTLAHFASLLSIDKSTLCNYEKGRRFPRSATIKKIEAVTNREVRLSDLLEKKN